MPIESVAWLNVRMFITSQVASDSVVAVVVVVVTRGPHFAPSY